jgi:hypothetical protein
LPTDLPMGYGRVPQLTSLVFKLTAQLRAEDAPQLGLVLGLKQSFKRAVRQLGKRLVGGREYGERARTFQRIRQPCRFDCGYECVEVSRDSRIYDIGCRRKGRTDAR